VTAFELSCERESKEKELDVHTDRHYCVSCFDQTCFGQCRMIMVILQEAGTNSLGYLENCQGGRIANAVKQSL
jgi:hypothetical protein